MSAPLGYCVINRWTEKVLFGSRDLNDAEDFYEAEVEDNPHDCIQLVAILRDNEVQS